MNQSESARREYGKARTSMFALHSRNENSDDAISCAVSRILCCSKDAIEAAEKWSNTRNGKCDPFPKVFRLEFARQMGSLAPVRLNCLPDCGPGSEVLDEYLSVVARLDAEWRKCDADRERWLTCKDTQPSAREQEESLDEIAYLAIKDKDPDLVPSSWPEDSFLPGFNPLRPHELETLSPWCRGRIPPFARKIVGQRSWVNVARIAAFARFAEVVEGRDQIRYCNACHRAFNAFSRPIFCSDKCGHHYSSQCSKKDKTRVQNRRRCMIATLILDRWLQNARGKWRPVAERELAREFLGPVGHKSRWLGGCIVAATLPDKDPKRRRLAELCTTKNANHQETKIVHDEMNRLLSLINRASRVENELVLKK